MIKILFISLALLLSNNNIIGSCKDLKKDINNVSIIKEVTKDLYCGSCSSYTLTYKVDGSALKDYILWDNIIKPKSHVIDDLGAFSMTYFPLSSVPTLRCSSCYHALAEPIKIRSGDVTRIAFILSAFKKRSISK